uniref:Fibroblast growth factor binding protein 1b n=1 Tax=Astyanax mexicanus TaxID=7994 RepID=A0A8B9JA50_ASTMX
KTLYSTTTCKLVLIEIASLQTSQIKFRGCEINIPKRLSNVLVCSGGKAASKGRFSTKDKMRCTWVATGDRALVLSISCTKGNESFHCEYTANPGLCPQYESNSGTFWKQITRAMKKQKKLCRDPKALLKAGVCKSASKEAHFSLKTPAQDQRPPQSGKKDCKGLSDRNKLAREHCNSSWSSVCTFFFAMFENEEC